MSRTRANTVPANYSERRIISLENFMLSTNLRGKAALAAFNRAERDANAVPAKPLVPADPQGLKLAAFMARLTNDIRDCRRVRGACLECGIKHCVGVHRKY